LFTSNGELSAMPTNSKAKSSITRSETEIRNIVLNYFYQRHLNSTSMTGKKGLAVKISDIKRELKQQSGLSQQEVVRTISYLEHYKWVEPYTVEKQVMTARGTTIPSPTIYYKITGTGIDKIEGG